MKKVLLIIIGFLLSLNLNAQWKYYQTNDDFEGKIKIASVYGIGINYPYNKPGLILNIFLKSPNNVNFYINNAGYWAYNCSVLATFNNDTTIYELNSSRSENNELLFLTGTYDFFNKLMTKSSVKFRIKSKLSTNTLTFGLRGSTKAINFVLPKNYISNLKLLKIKRKKIYLKGYSIMLENNFTGKLSDIINYVDLYFNLQELNSIVDIIFKQDSDNLAFLHFLNEKGEEVGTMPCPLFSDISW